MSFPLAFLKDIPDPSPDVSLGEHLANVVTDAGCVTTLLDCLCSTDAPAIWSTDATRPPLTHAALRRFIADFALPTSGLHGQLLPNDRVMVVLPTSPENAVALLSVSTYHTCAPVNSGCTAGELAEDAARLRAKAILTTPDAIDRLDLNRLRDELRCELILVRPRSDGPAGLFDMSAKDESDDDDSWVVAPSSTRPQTRPHGLGDQSLVLHTSGTSGRKKVRQFSEPS